MRNLSKIGRQATPPLSVEKTAFPETAQPWSRSDHETRSKPGAAEDALARAAKAAKCRSPRAYWINGRSIPVDGLEQPHAPRNRRPY